MKNILLSLMFVFFYLQDVLTISQNAMMKMLSLH